MSIYECIEHFWKLFKIVPLRNHRYMQAFPYFRFHCFEHLNHWYFFFLENGEGARQEDREYCRYATPTTHFKTF